MNGLSRREQVFLGRQGPRSQRIDTCTAVLIELSRDVIKDGVR